MPVTYPPQQQHLPNTKKFYCDLNGSDNYDGRSQRWPKSTLAAVQTLAGSQGDIYYGPSSFPLADTLTYAQGLRPHGTSWHNAAGGGTEFLLTGFPDDGRPAILTAASDVADATKWVMEDIRITGPTGMTGGGNGINLRNGQNGTEMWRVQITGFDSGTGIYAYTTTQNVNFPAYMLFRNVWSTNNLAGWEIESGTCITNLINCAGDCTTVSGFKGAMLVTNSSVQGVTAKAITAATSSGYTATITATAHGLSAGHLTEISGVTPTGYNGLYRVETIPTADTFTIVTPTANLAAGSVFGSSQRKNGGERGEIKLDGFKSEIGFDVANAANFEFRTNARVLAVACSSRNTTGTKPAFSYTGTRYAEASAAVLYPYPPVELRKCQSTNHPWAFTAPQFGIYEPAITTAGRTTMIDWPKPNAREPAHAAKPAAAVRENVPRLGTALTAQAMLSSGRLNYVAMPLRAGDIISSFTFCSFTTAAVTPTNQWAVLMDPSRNVVAKSADKTTEAWGVPVAKTFTVATDAADNPITFYRVPADGLYFVGICVVAATVPSLAGVSGGSTIIADIDPNMSANSDTGLTDPASCPDTPSAGTAVAAHFYCYVS